MSPAGANAAHAPLIDSMDPVIESMSPAAADAAPDPVMEYVTSSLAEPIPVDEHMSEERTAAAGDGFAESVGGGSLLAGRPPGPGGRRRGAACAQEDETQEALT